MRSWSLASVLSKVVGEREIGESEKKHFSSLSKSILHVGQLTLDVFESPSYVGELVFRELTRWRNDQ